MDTRFVAEGQDLEDEMLIAGHEHIVRKEIANCLSQNDAGTV